MHTNTKEPSTLEKLKNVATVLQADSVTDHAKHEAMRVITEALIEVLEPKKDKA